MSKKLESGGLCNRLVPLTEHDLLSTHLLYYDTRSHDTLCLLMLYYVTLHALYLYLMFNTRRIYLSSYDYHLLST